MKIMMYYDGTDHTREALPAVMERARAFNAKVHVVSSLPRGEERDLKDIEKITAGLASLQAAFDSQGVPCETHLLIKGHTADHDIAAFARKHAVDEIVIGTDRGSLLERMLKGWMARRVVGTAQCPVLLA